MLSSLGRVRTRIGLSRGQMDIGQGVAVQFGGGSFSIDQPRECGANREDDTYRSNRVGELFERGCQS